MLTVYPSYRLGVFFIYFSFYSYIFIIRFGAFFYFSVDNFYTDYLIFRFGVSFYFPFHRDLWEAPLGLPGDQHADRQRHESRCRHTSGEIAEHAESG